MANRMNNDMAVSPIVATLVLIVVAVIGAVAVGTIMGTFSTDVSKQANAGNAASASSAEILIAGSTTVQPASEALAKAYMEAHPGIKITVQGGGSGAGIAAANNGLVDIGSASKAVDTTKDYPELTSYTIGGSAVVVVGSADVTGTTSASAAELKALYQSGTPIGQIDHAVQRNEDSGTEETFAKYIGYTNAADQLDTCHGNVTAAVGNGGVADTVADGENTIGFVDYGFAKDRTDLVILDIEVGADTYTADEDTIIASLQGASDDPADTYVAKLTRPLNYLVKGTPSSVVKNYIDFCRAPGSIEIMEEAGYVPYVSFA